MIVLKLGKTTGTQVSKIVHDAIVNRRKETGHLITRMDFCRAAKISRMALYEYANNAEPGIEGLTKIAMGLKAWGMEVEIEV